MMPCSLYQRSQRPHCAASRSRSHRPPRRRRRLLLAAVSKPTRWRNRSMSGCRVRPRPRPARRRRLRCRNLSGGGTEVRRRPLRGAGTATAAASRRPVASRPIVAGRRRRRAPARTSSWRSTSSASRAIAAPELLACRRPGNSRTHSCRPDALVSVQSAQRLGRHPRPIDPLRANGGSIHIRRRCTDNEPRLWCTCASHSGILSCFIDISMKNFT